MAKYSVEERERLIYQVGSMGIPWSAAILDAAMVHEPDWSVKLAEKWVRATLNNLLSFERHGIAFSSDQEKIRACEAWLAQL